MLLEKQFNKKIFCAKHLSKSENKFVKVNFFTILRCFSQVKASNSYFKSFWTLIVKMKALLKLFNIEKPSCLFVTNFIQNFQKHSSCRRYQIQKIWDQKGNTWTRYIKQNQNVRKKIMSQPGEQTWSWYNSSYYNKASWKIRRYLFALWYKVNVLLFYWVS